MGFFDDITTAVNRGTDSAGRAAEKAKLKARINEINKKRTDMAAQLGASLYEVTKDDTRLREGREPLYEGIAALDAERAECQARIEALDQQAQEQVAAAQTFSCVVCGNTMRATDLFCSGCGSPAEKARPTHAFSAPAAAVPGVVCRSCGAAMEEDDLFCMTCGARAAAPASDKGESQVI